MPLLVTASNSLPYGKRSINSPHELLLYLVDQLRPCEVEYSIVFLAGLMRIISLPNMIICGIIYSIDLRVQRYKKNCGCANFSVESL